MAKEDPNRRDFLKLGGAAVATALASANISSPPVDDQERTRTQPETPAVRLPGNYEDILALSDEQKIMLSAAVASGCDAVAYYTPGQEGFTLNKHMGLYDENVTFVQSISYDKNSKAASVSEAKDGQGHITYQIPVRADGHIKGVIVLHPSDTPWDRAEPQECKTAKLHMAQDIVNEHADLFGISGAILKQREEAHRSPEQKRQFFMKLIKDMYSTFTRRVEEDPQSLPNIKNAKGVLELKAALRNAQGWSASAQYSHVLGVTDLMQHALEKAINKDPAKPVMNNSQVELMELLAMLHDVGKTQLPSQYMALNGKLAPGAETEFSTFRNGSHPVLGLALLSLYKQDAIDAMAHHSGLKRFGPDEIADLKRRKSVRPDFDQFTTLTGPDIAPDKLPPLSKVLRIADVTEAITGRADIPLHEAIKQLGTVGKEGGSIYDKVRLDKSGKPIINPDTIDPDYLCFFIVNDVFKAYGEQRCKQTPGKIVGDHKEPDWISHNKRFEGQPKYDLAKIDKESAEVLHRFGWDKAEVRAAKEKEILQKIAGDPLLAENRGAARAQPGMIRNG